MQGGFGGGGVRVCLCALYLEVHVQVIVVNLSEEEGVVKVLRASVEVGGVGCSVAWDCAWRVAVCDMWLCVTFDDV